MIMYIKGIEMIMNRLNGANCIVYMSDGTYKGKYTCCLEIVDNQNMGILTNTPIDSKMVKILIKGAKESLINCKLTMYNHRENTYMALKDYVVLNEKFDNEEVWITDDEQNIKSRIEEISKEEYERLETQEIDYIDWENINTKLTGEEIAKDKAFENLCSELINEIKMTKEGTFKPRGGGDAGRDFVWRWPAIDKVNINFLDLPDELWVMQCKYSEDINKNLSRVEIWDEIIKVIQHKPSHYIIFTNKNITSAFYDWWNSISEFDNRRSKFIPFTLHFVGREDVEKLLNLCPSIKERYFTSKKK